MTTGSVISPNPLRDDTDLADPATSTLLVIVTEGATDPLDYEKVVGRGHGTVGRVLTAMR